MIRKPISKSDREYLNKSAKINGTKPFTDYEFYIMDLSTQFVAESRKNDRPITLKDVDKLEKYFNDNLKEPEKGIVQ